MKLRDLVFALTFSLSALTATASDEPTPTELLVGVTAIDTEPAIGIPLGGYGAKERRLPKFFDLPNKYPHCHFFRPSEGVHTPIRSKVMVLKKDGRHLVFISLDTIGVEWRFLEDLAKRLKPFGIKAGDIVMTGTHTHSGPGTFSRKLPLELIAVDLFVKKNYDFMLAKVLQSVHVALAQMEPAELFETSFLAENMQVNKFRYKDQPYYNNKASFLLARSKSSKNWLGGLMNFAVHGGGMPVGLMKYSSDLPGQMEMNVQNVLDQKNVLPEHPTTILFMNGAEGDVAVKGGRGVELIEDLGREFGRQAAPAFAESNLKPVAGDFEVKRQRTWIGIPATPLKYCVGGIFAKANSPLKVPLVPFMNQNAYLSAIRIGHLTMMTWPGEASTSLGRRLQGEAEKLGHPNAWVLGLANDYMAYFTSKTEYNEGVYDSCSSLYNWKGADRIIKRHKKLVAELQKPIAN